MYARKLDGKMAKATDTDDTDAVGRRDPVAIQCLKHGRAPAEERTRVDKVNLVGHTVEKRLANDGVAGEGADVEITDAVQDSLWAVHL